MLILHHAQVAITEMEVDQQNKLGLSGHRTAQYTAKIITSTPLFVRGNYDKDTHIYRRDASLKPKKAHKNGC